MGLEDIKVKLIELKTGDLSDAAKNAINKKITDIDGLIGKIKDQDLRGAGEDRDPSRFYRPKSEMSKVFRSYGGINATPRYVSNIFQNSEFFERRTLQERLAGVKDLAEQLFKQKYETRLDIRESSSALDVTTQTKNIGQQFSNIMVLDYFNNLAKEVGLGSLFQRQEAGYLFESFLALLLGGTVEGGSANVEDIILSSVQGKPPSGPDFVSAKLITENKYVSQAGSTVQNFFLKHGDNAKFTYVVAYKVSKGYSSKDKENFKDGVGDKSLSFVEIPLFVKEYTPNDFPDIANGVFETESVKFFQPNEKISQPDRFTRTDITPKAQKDLNDIAEPGKGQSSGTYVFKADKLRDQSNYIGSVVLPQDESVFDEIMSNALDELDLNIKQVYNQLAEFEASMKSFYSAKEIDDTIKFGNTAMDRYNDLTKEVGTSISKRITDEESKETLKGKQTFSQRDKLKPRKLTENEKVTANFLKKLIEESFKR